MARLAVLCVLLLSIVASCSQVADTGQQTILPKRSEPAAEPEVNMQYTWQATPDSLQIHLLFFDISRLMELSRTATDLSFDVVGDGKEVLLRDTVKVGKSQNHEEGLVLQVNVSRQLVTDNAVLHLKLWQKFAGEARMHSAFKIQLTPGMLDKTALLMQAKSQVPLIRNYITTSDSLQLISADTTANLLVYRFKPEFTPALPPMSERQEAQPRILEPLDSLTISPNTTFTLQQEGLYLLWPRTSYANGLLVEPWHFPQVTMAKELVQPLIYLTTSTERERLYKARDPKKAVDDFWIQVAGEKHLARELIRTYYGRVEHANRLYTSHKAGWATDRGMIYLVYGPPSDISKVGNTETWIYRESEMQPYIKFVFTKKQNNFTENHYELIRRREYEESWYSTVAKWRAGITDM